MKKATGIMLALAVGSLLVELAGAEVSEVSADMPLDTRSIAVAADPEDQALDSRSHTMAWSLPRKLSTKRIVGTVFLMR